MTLETSKFLQAQRLSIFRIWFKEKGVSVKHPLMTHWVYSIRTCWKTRPIFDRISQLSKIIITESLSQRELSVSCVWGGRIEILLMEKMLKAVRGGGLSPLCSVKKTSPTYALGGCFSQLQSRGKDSKVRSFTSKVSQEQVSVGTSSIFEIHLAQEKGLEQKGEFGIEGCLEKRAAIQKRCSQRGR